MGHLNYKQATLYFFKNIVHLRHPVSSRRETFKLRKMAVLLFGSVTSDCTVMMCTSPVSHVAKGQLALFAGLY
jgi:hypothetical protein